LAVQAILHPFYSDSNIELRSAIRRNTRLREGMSRDIFLRSLAAADAFVHSAPNLKQRSRSEVDRLGSLVTAARLRISDFDSLRFHACDRDDALGCLKLTSVVVAGLATMVLSETRGL